MKPSNPELRAWLSGANSPRRILEDELVIPFRFREGFIIF
jgi:hypothetical protein